MASIQPISSCLWFDNQAEEAANYYLSIFGNGKIHSVKRYGKAGFEFHKQPEGSVMTVDFELNGNRFLGLNGGPIFNFNESISFMVNCETQEEIDYYWEKLSTGGNPEAQVCGWLKDKYGLSWQIVPNMMDELTPEQPTPASERMMNAMMQMKKLDIAALRKAYEGK